MKRFHCYNLGCQEILLNSKLISYYMEVNQWKKVTEPKLADLILFNTCGATKESEKASTLEYERLNSIKLEDAKILSVGCLSAINRQALEDSGYNEQFISPIYLHKLDGVIDATIPFKTVQSQYLSWFNNDSTETTNKKPQAPIKEYAKSLFLFLKKTTLPLPRFYYRLLHHVEEDEKVALIPIGTGCLGKCSFCVIKRAKGSIKSIPRKFVVEMVEVALKKGHDRIVLCCDEVGPYGQDIDSNIGELLEDLMTIPGDFQLILRNFGPEWLIKYWKRLKPIFSQGRVAILTASLQSGSDKVLGLMRRNYTSGEYKWIIEKIRKASQTVIIDSHVIVGFPGETEEDFWESYHFAQIESHTIQYDPGDSQIAKAAQQLIPFIEVITVIRLLSKEDKRESYSSFLFLLMASSRSPAAL